MTSVPCVALALTAVAPSAQSGVITIEAFKDNAVVNADPDSVFDGTGANGNQLAVQGPTGSVPVGTLTYAAFDLSGLPDGAIITAARVGGNDARTNRSNTIYVSLADVADDWIESGAGGLTWNTAVASYGATTGTEGKPDGSGTTTNNAMVDFSTVLWQGTMAMNANPGFVWAESRSATSLVAGADTFNGGVARTDAELVGALNNILGGDQTAVFVYNGTSGNNNYMTERNFGEGPTLELTYVVPEPGSLALLWVGGACMLFGKRR